MCAVDFLQLPGEELVKLPDEDLGQWLVTAWLAFQADKAGIDRSAIPREWATQLVEKSSKMDSDSVANSSLESMFRKACAGDVASAGRMLRTYLISRAEAVVRDKYAGIGIEHAKGRKRGGKKTANARQAASKAVHAKWVDAARSLLEQGKSSRDLAGILATRFNVTARAIRDALKKAEVK